MCTIYCNPSTSTLFVSSPLKKSSSSDLAMVYVFATGESKAVPENETRGLSPTRALSLLNCEIVLKVSASTCNSSISNTLWSKNLTKVTVCGRFLECEPNTIKLQSFFSAKNSSDEGSSKGWMSFFFVNFWARGRLRLCRSPMQSWTISEHEV